MKKRFIFILAASVALLLWAESKMIFHFSGGSLESINLSDIDTIRFNNGDIVVGKANKQYTIAVVDSATFELENSVGDTVFVTYNGSSVNVINPYPEDSITVVSDGANVEVASSVDRKGVVYYLSGTSTDGSFTLTPSRGYTLVFDNLSLTSATTSPIILNKGADGSSYAATVNLIGASSIADGSSNTNKGAILSKSKLKIYKNENAQSGSLTVTGNYKHAINSSKRLELYGGELIIAGAVTDGFNGDGVEVYDGTLKISGVNGDGVDCSEVVRIEGGNVVVESTVDDTKGLKCDSIIEITGGNVNITVSGAGSKALKSGYKTILSGGEVTTILSATAAFVDTDGSYSYNAGIKSDTSIVINGGSLKVTGAGIAARALNCDKDVEISGGSFTADLTGAHCIETSDTSSVFGIKADGSVNISSGTSIINIGTAATASKGIKAATVDISGGELTIVNNGKYFSSTSSSSSSGSSSQGGRPGQGGSSWGQTTTTADFVTAKAIKVDTDFTITGGTVSLTANYGKGIISDGTVTLGAKNGSESDFKLNITAGSSDCGTYTSGSSSSWGGMGGGGGGESRTKVNGKPKGISTDGEININAGTITIKAFDTGILSTSAPINVNGGLVYIDAQYDQGIFAKYSTLTFNGGFVKVSNSYEAFSGKIMIFNEGSSTYAVSSDDAWNATDGNESSSEVHIYVNGGVHYAVGAGDGLDSNGDMAVSGGIVVCSQTGNGNSPIDTDSGWTHTGGFVLACGGSGMFSETIPNSSAGHIYTSSGMSISQNQYLIVANTSGSVLAAFKVPQSAQAAVCAYNSSVTNYKFYVGSSFSETLDYFDGVFGLYDSNQPTISTSNYTAYSVSTTNGNTGGGGRW